MNLPNALKFQRSYDPSCTCKPPTRSWAEVLAPAEDLLEARSGDILVTPEKAEELSRPASVAGPRSRPASALPRDQKPGASQAAAQGPVLSLGEIREVIGPNGIKRRVRIVGPTL
jgi:hypothetical protein